MVSIILGSSCIILSVVGICKERELKAFYGLGFPIGLLVLMSGLI
jgi:hypothetical protein